MDSSALFLFGGGLLLCVDDLSHISVTRGGHSFSIFSGLYNIAPLSCICTYLQVDICEHPPQPPCLSMGGGAFSL